MSSVIWTLTLLTLASSGLCVIPTPVNLSISSRNYIHLLTWEPGPGSPDGLSYGVEVYSLGSDTSLHVPGCEEVVSPLECNLTDVMPDPRDQYFTNVTANLGIQSSTQGMLGAFRPMDETILDPPLLNVSFCGQALCVGLRPPSGRLQQVYSSLLYTLMVSNSKDGAQYPLSTKGLGGEKIKHVEPGRKYCVTATIAGRKADRKSASSQPQCAEPTVLYSPDREISLALSVLLITFLAVMFYLGYTECICKRSTFPEILILLKSQDVQALFLNYEEEAYSLVHVEAWTTAPPTTGGQEQGSSRNSICEEDGEAEPTGDAGYERRPGMANHISCSGGTSSDNPPPAAGYVLPSESRRDVSQTGTDSQDSSGCVGDDGPLSSSLAREGPLSLAREGPLSLAREGPLSLSGEGPLSLPLTGEGPLSLPLTGEGPLSLPLTGEGPLSLPLAGEGPLSLAREGPLSLAREGPLSLAREGPLSLAGEGPLSLSVAKNEPWPLSLTATEVRPASVEGGVQADEDGSGLNVNLLSVMLAGHEEEEEDEEEEDHNRPCVQTDHGYERRPFLLGVSSVSPPVLPISAAVTEPSHTQACTIYSQEDEEDDDEEDDDDDDDEEEFSGYMRNFLITS
ncbi:uncharacterized protein LOC133125088 [Conger conger]|uniref:uncharacterized protein LOC133125088 n=1 Tax=Conger conger TaxID=82655 RepID=UPI002A5A4488|nr:uncharacterized protein LOC133125088 [Conger conger]